MESKYVLEVKILNKLILIDGNSLSFRAFMRYHYYKIKLVFIRTPFMVLQCCWKNYKRRTTHTFLVAFDAGKTTFRHAQYSEYKGGRQSTPPELSEQFPYVRQLLDAYHIKRYELENYEADDIIGTLSKQANHENFQTIIITGDRDLTQLATDDVTIYYTKRVLQMLTIILQNL